MKHSHLESSPEVTKPTFQRVAENLNRRVPSGSYYAVLKRDGKQIWKSLKTPDRKLAECRLAEFAGPASNLRPQDNPHVTFPELANRWLDNRRHTSKASTAS